MSTSELLTAVLTLPEKERGEFADAFNSAQLELDAEFNEMLLRRVREYESGVTPAIPGDEAMRLLELEAEEQL